MAPLESLECNCILLDGNCSALVIELVVGIVAVGIVAVGIDVALDIVAVGIDAALGIVAVGIDVVALDIVAVHIDVALGIHEVVGIVDVAVHDNQFSVQCVLH